MSLSSEGSVRATREAEALTRQDVVGRAMRGELALVCRSGRGAERLRQEYRRTGASLRLARSLGLRLPIHYCRLAPPVPKLGLAARAAGAESAVRLHRTHWAGSTVRHHHSAI